MKDEGEVELSIVMPCLNEAETVGRCVEKARRALRDMNCVGEIIVADNGSADGSPEVAQSSGARVIRVQTIGYGSALLGGIQAARGRYIIMGDADDSYDFENLAQFLERLRAGYDLVMGNRFTGGIQPGAMPGLHRYLGNPFLSSLGRLLFRSPCHDFHCGLRGFSKEAALRMDLRTTGMEFASEMVVKATLSRMRIAEVPITLSPAGRSRRPHLRSWRDGWRHLRFLLLFSPRWLFLIPGGLLMLAGATIGLWLLPGPRRVGRVAFDVHTLVYSMAFVFAGFQAVLFALLTKIFAIGEGLLPEDPRLTRVFRYITLEVGIAVGMLLTLLGLAGSIYATGAWGTRHFGPLDPSRSLRIVIPSVTFLTLGLQVILTSFFLSVLGLKRR
jgi:glycosyltransferase involved in cell wall biosynthesis